jgi:hypothetical protein
MECFLQLQIYKHNTFQQKINLENELNFETNCKSVWVLIAHVIDKQTETLACNSWHQRNWQVRRRRFRRLPMMVLRTSVSLHFYLCQSRDWWTDRSNLMSVLLERPCKTFQSLNCVISHDVFRHVPIYSKSCVQGECHRWIKLYLVPENGERPLGWFLMSIRRQR